MRITSLGSGSSGNAYLIEAGPHRRTRLLVDAGFSMRLLRERLALAGCVPQDLRGVLVTHEHSDHIMGLPPLLKYCNVPIYADPRTLGELRNIVARGIMRSETGALVRLDGDTGVLSVQEPGRLSVQEPDVLSVQEPDVLSVPESGMLSAQESGQLNVPESGRLNVQEPGVLSVQESGLLAQPELPLLDVPSAFTGRSGVRKAEMPWDADGLWRDFPEGTSRVIGDIEVRSFPVSHDAIAPCGYLLSAGGCRVCIITDSGMVTPVMQEALAEADLLILEANHDRARLLSGPYPYSLKQRILSSTGHLSNAQAAEAVLHTWRSDAVRWLWLAHLSRTNNTPKLALTSMQESLSWAGASLGQIHMTILAPDMGPTWDSSRLWIDENLWKI